MKKGPRPEKPYAAYPLHAHASGQWSARINGKARFFGVWADPKGALARYLAYMNGTPVASAEAVGDRVDAFRLDKTAQLAGLPATGPGNDPACFVRFGYASANEAGWRWDNPNSNLRIGSISGGTSADRREK